MTLKKMLTLTSSFPRYNGDFAGSFVFELAKNLQDYGFSVTVLAAHHPGARSKEEFEGINIYRYQYFFPAKFQKLYRDGGWVYNFRKSTLAKFQVPLFFISELYFATKIIKQEQIEILHSHWLMPQGFIGTICKKIFNIPHVITIHAADIFLLENLPFKNVIADFIAKDCDEIIIVSSYVSERFLTMISSNLKEYVENKITVLPMGIDVLSFQEHKDIKHLKHRYTISSKFTLLYIGRLADKKGISYLIEAMPTIIKHINDVCLIICGDGHLLGELIQIVKKLNLERYVTFTGFVSNDIKLDYISIADIVIVPSLVLDTGETEGLPVVILEYLAAGKPIIATNVSGIKDVIESGWNGILIEQRSSEQISNQVLRLLSDEELRISLGENARISGSKFDWSLISYKYADLFKRLLFQITSGIRSDDASSVGSQESG